MSAIGELIDRLFPPGMRRNDAHKLINALDVPADTPLANLVALQPGQYVVEASSVKVFMDECGDRGVLDLRCFDAHVVREAVPVRADQKGDSTHVQS